jgi:hypothetical protein
MNQPLPNARYDTLLGEYEREDVLAAQALGRRAEYLEMARQESVRLWGSKDPVMQSRVFQSEVAASRSMSEYAAGLETTVFADLARKQQVPTPPQLKKIGKNLRERRHPRAFPTGTKQHENCVA